MEKIGEPCAPSLVVENVEDEDDPIYSLIEAKRIVRRGKSNYGAESPAEYMGKASNKILNTNVIEYLKKKPYGENFSRSELGETINISKDMPIETKSQFVKEIFNEKVNITDDVKRYVSDTTGGEIEAVGDETPLFGSIYTFKISKSSSYKVIPSH